MARKEEIRPYLPTDLGQLLRRVLALREDKNWTISDAVTEAISDWLTKPENVEVIERYRLKD